MEVKLKEGCLITVMQGGLDVEEMGEIIMVLEEVAAEVYMEEQVAVAIIRVTINTIKEMEVLVEEDI